MYYHVRLDKKFHGGGTDMDARVAWDFRSLRKALEMISRDYGPGAAAWRVEHLTDRTGDVMRFENVLQTALESTHQYIIMAFKDDDPALRKYDHYEFFISARDEEECPPEFSFSQGDEAEIEAAAME